MDRFGFHLAVSIHKWRSDFFVWISIRLAIPLHTHTHTRAGTMCSVELRVWLKCEQQTMADEVISITRTCTNFAYSIEEWNAIMGTSGTQATTVILCELCLYPICEHRAPCALDWACLCVFEMCKLCWAAFAAIECTGWRFPVHVISASNVFKCLVSHWVVEINRHTRKKPHTNIEWKDSPNAKQWFRAAVHAKQTHTKWKFSVFSIAIAIYSRMCTECTIGAALCRKTEANTRNSIKNWIYVWIVKENARHRDRHSIYYYIYYSFVRRMRWVYAVCVCVWLPPMPAAYSRAHYIRIYGTIASRPFVRVYINEFIIIISFMRENAFLCSHRLSGLIMPLPSPLVASHKNVREACLVRVFCRWNSCALFASLHLLR